MRRCFLLMAAVTTVLLIVQVLSLWQFVWRNGGRSTQAALGQGCVRLWLGKPGDFPAAWPGLSTGGWSGGAMMWKPESSQRAKLWVIPPAASGTTPMARQITGVCIILPVYLVLLPALASTGCLGVLLWRRSRRPRWACGACGYDLRGVSGRCPECGREFTRSALAAAGRAIRRVLARGRGPAAGVAVARRPLYAARLACASSISQRG